MKNLDNIFTTSKKLENANFPFKIFSDFGILFEKFFPHNFHCNFCATILVLATNEGIQLNVATAKNIH